MNFLELCQEVRSECGIQGDGPTSVVGQTGILAKVVRWTREAYTQLQARPLQWDWLQHEIDFPVVAGEGEYDLLSGASWARPDVGRFLDSNSWIKATAAGSQKYRVGVRTHNEFLREVTDRTQVGMPSLVTITPQRLVRFNRVPDQDYTYTVECRLTPEVLSENSHVPAMPEQHHRVIVLAAIKYYARHDGDIQLTQGILDEWRTAYPALVRECVPPIEWTSFKSEDPI
jgi:hypothetical protein